MESLIGDRHKYIDLPCWTETTYKNPSGPVFILLMPPKPVPNPISLKPVAENLESALDQFASIHADLISK